MHAAVSLSLCLSLLITEIPSILFLYFFLTYITLKLSLDGCYQHVGLTLWGLKVIALGTICTPFGVAIVLIDLRMSMIKTYVMLKNLVFRNALFSGTSLWSLTNVWSGWRIVNLLLQLKWHCKGLTKDMAINKNDWRASNPICSCSRS